MGNTLEVEEEERRKAQRTRFAKRGDNETDAKTTYSNDATIELFPESSLKTSVLPPWRFDASETGNAESEKVRRALYVRDVRIGLHPVHHAARKRHDEEEEEEEEKKDTVENRGTCEKKIAFTEYATNAYSAAPTAISAGRPGSVKKLGNYFEDRIEAARREMRRTTASLIDDLEKWKIVRERARSCPLDEFDRRRAKRRAHVKRMREKKAAIEKLEVYVKENTFEPTPYDDATMNGESKVPFPLKTLVVLIDVSGSTDNSYSAGRNAGRADASSWDSSVVESFATRGARFEPLDDPPESSKDDDGDDGDDIDPETFAEASHEGATKCGTKCIVLAEMEAVSAFVAGCCAAYSMEGTKTIIATFSNETYAYQFDPKSNEELMFGLECVLKAARYQKGRTPLYSAVSAIKDVLDALPTCEINGPKKSVVQLNDGDFYERQNKHPICWVLATDGQPNNSDVPGGLSVTESGVDYPPLFSPNDAAFVIGAGSVGAWESERKEEEEEEEERGGEKAYARGLVSVDGRVYERVNESRYRPLGSSTGGDRDVSDQILYSRRGRSFLPASEADAMRKSFVSKFKGAGRSAECNLGFLVSQLAVAVGEYKGAYGDLSDVRDGTAHFLSRIEALSRTTYFCEEEYALRRRLFVPLGVTTKKTGEVDAKDGAHVYRFSRKSTGGRIREALHEASYLDKDVDLAAKRGDTIICAFPHGVYAIGGTGQTRLEKVTISAATGGREGGREAKDVRRSLVLNFEDEEPSKHAICYSSPFGGTRVIASVTDEVSTRTSLILSDPKSHVVGMRIEMMAGELWNRSSAYLRHALEDVVGCCPCSGMMATVDVFYALNEQKIIRRRELFSWEKLREANPDLEVYICRDGELLGWARSFAHQERNAM